MTKATFYIHIGMHKTGTTSLQHALFDNRERLLAHGFNYLSLQPNHSAPLVSLLAERPHRYRSNIRLHVDTPHKARAHNAKVRERLIAALAANASPNMVISGEGLSVLPEVAVEALKTMLDPYAGAYRIVVYVREPVDYLNSAALQRLKGGAILSNRKQPTPLPHYRRRIEKFITVFGRENVDIRVYDPARFIGGNLTSDFLSVIGAPPELTQAIATPRLNASLSHEAATILSAVNEIVPVRIDGRANPARAFDLHHRLSGIAGERYVIPEKTYRRVAPRLARDLAWLHRTMREPVFGTPQPHRASTAQWSDATRESIRSLLAEMAASIAQLGGTPPALSETIDTDNPRALGRRIHAMTLRIQRMRAAAGLRGNRWLMLRNPAAAERHARAAIRLDPDNAAAHRRLSEACLMRGDLRAARAAARTAAALAPERAGMRRWLRVVETAAGLLRVGEAPQRQERPQPKRRGKGARPQGPFMSRRSKRR